MRLPSRRKLPSSTFSTFSFFLTSLTSTLLPLNEKDEVRATTRNPSTFASASRISSLMPSQKYSWSFAGLRSTKGNTATPSDGGDGNDVLFQMITPTVAAKASDNANSSAIVGFRRIHLLPRVRIPVRRARIGSRFSQCLRSSASAREEEERRCGAFSWHL